MSQIVSLLGLDEVAAIRPVPLTDEAFAAEMEAEAERQRSAPRRERRRRTRQIQHRETRE